MPDIVVYYHDPAEVNPRTSWTGLVPGFDSARYVNIAAATETAVIDLFDYARPDAVIAIDGVPIVSIEQTAMNPSGHNIPQRFSFHVRAAELGIPSILYYPEFSRRTYSDPNPRYVQVRVPLAQRQLSSIYNIPALSVFWPTDPNTLLPQVGQAAHAGMANVINALITNAGNKQLLLQLPPIQHALREMDRVVTEHAHKYDLNSSVRLLIRQGFPSAGIPSGASIDPPAKAQLHNTSDFLGSLPATFRSPQWPTYATRLQTRPHTLVFTGTLNKAGNDSEHPWPGYLTLLDVLYSRRLNGLTVKDRNVNLVYVLPVPITTYLNRANSLSPPTPTYIVDTFADLSLVSGGVVVGKPLRGTLRAQIDAR